jgi:RNA-directed DNA polymerase
MSEIAGLNASELTSSLVNAKPGGRAVTRMAKAESALNPSTVRGDASGVIEEARENGKRRELEKPSHVPGKSRERRGWPDNRKGKGRSCEGGGGARKSEESPESGTEQRGPAVEDPTIKGREGRLKTPNISLQDLRRRIYDKAKSDKTWRFWGMYVHMSRMDTLWESYRKAKANDGAAGVDGETFGTIESKGVEGFLEEIREDLLKGSYTPQPNRVKEIPKGNGKTRKLGIPTIKDRVVQGAVTLILEAIFEADFCDNTYGYRPGRSCAGALHRVTEGVMGHGLTEVIDVDLSGYFDNIRHHLLLAQIAKRVNDGKVMGLIKKILKAQGNRGVPQGGPLSCVLANVYLGEVDRVFERAEERTRMGKKVRVHYTRYVDDMVILVGKDSRWPNLKDIAMRRLREELTKLDVSLNEEKTKIVDLLKGEPFGYLGFDCRMAWSRRGNRFLLKTPKQKKRVAIMARIREVLHRYGRMTVQAVIQRINPILRGWVNYFRIGHASKAFRYVRWCVERRIRRLALRKKLRQGFGWKRWSSAVIYGKWGLYDDYRVSYYRPARENDLSLLRVYGLS